MYSLSRHEQYHHGCLSSWSWIHDFLDRNVHADVFTGKNRRFILPHSCSIVACSTARLGLSDAYFILFLSSKTLFSMIRLLTGPIGYIMYMHTTETQALDSEKKLQHLRQVPVHKHQNFVSIHMVNFEGPVTYENIGIKQEPKSV